MGETTAGTKSVRVFNNLSRLNIKPDALAALREKGPNGGRLYRSEAGTFEVYGEILEKYLSFGGPRSVLGMPVTNETGCPDGVGRFNHFQGGSIYWTPETGAHVIYGAIRDRWAAMGWERSYLGYPTTDEVDFDEGGRVSSFQGGQIYWWADTGAMDLNDVIVQYTGLVCFEETSWDQSSSADEPYAIFGVITPQGGYTKRSQIYTGVDDGESRAELAEIYRGKPAGLAFETVIMEHDEGDPNAHQKEVQAAVTAAVAAVAAVLGTVTGVGAVLTVLGSGGLAVASRALAEEVQELFDFGDDQIGSGKIELSPKAMVLLAARTPGSSFKGIGYKVETPMISGDGASYKAYFSVIRA